MASQSLGFRVVFDLVVRLPARLVGVGFRLQDSKV